MEFKDLKNAAKELSTATGIEIKTVGVKRSDLETAVREVAAKADVSALSAETRTVLSELGVDVGEAAAAPAAETAPEFPVEYPAPAEMTKDVFAQMTAEYKALKAVESPNEEQAKRLEYLKAHGKAVNEYLKAKKAGKADPAPAAETTEEGELSAEQIKIAEAALKVEVSDDDLQALAKEINEVLNYDEADKLNPAAPHEELQKDVVEAMFEIREKDFQALKGRVTFTKAAAETLKKLGCPALPKGKGKAGKAPRASRKSTEPKGPGVIEVIISTLKDAGKKGASKEDILAALTKAFPDREPDKMKVTINCQVPSRLASDKGIKLVRDGKNYVMQG